MASRRSLTTRADVLASRGTIDRALLRPLKARVRADPRETTAAMRCVRLCAADADEGAFFLLRAM
jgi:hypothetical protein